MGSLSLLVVLAVVTALLVALYRVVALHIGLVDTPNERSSHRRATVSGSGIVIALVFVLMLAFLVYREQIEVSLALLFTGAGGLAVIGWLDDRYRLSIVVRLMVYAAAAILSVLALGVQPLFAAVAAVVFILAHANLFNFMDGIDGLALCQSIFCCAAAAWLMPGDEANDLIHICAGLAAICTGALLLNWPPAKVFLGDAGSIFLGFCLAVLAVCSAVAGVLHFTTWLILFAAFICDSAVTLLARAAAGDKVYLPHRTHVYQLLARYYNSHAAATSVYLLTNLLFLLPIAVLVEAYEKWHFYYLLMTYVPLLGIIYGLRKRLLSFQRDIL